MDQAGGKQKGAGKLLSLSPTSLNSIIEKCGLASGKRAHNLFSMRRSVVRKKAKDHSRKTFLEIEDGRL
jgi:endonuclease III